MDEKTIKIIAENYSDFHELIEAAASRYLSCKGTYYRYIEEDELEIYDDMIRFKYSDSRCGCCSSYEYDSMPLEYLWTDNWKETVKSEVEQEKKKAERKKKREMAAAKAAKTKAEKKKYEELKQKYEGDK